MAEDIGESFVGAYLPYVRECEFILFNTFLPGEQGEIDVIGMRTGEPRTVYFAEVTTHLGGMGYGGCSWHGRTCPNRPVVSFYDAQGRSQAGCERAVRELVARGDIMPLTS